MNRTEVDISVLAAVAAETEQNLLELGPRAAVRLARSRLQAIQTNASAIACNRLCAMCCYMPVTLSMSEAQAIARALSRHPNLSDVVARLERGYKAIAGKSYDDLHAENHACALLDEQSPGRGYCTIYDERPIACRTMTSHDLELCSAQFRDPTSDVSNPSRSMDFAFSGVVNAILGGGDGRGYELRGVLLALLTNQPRNVIFEEEGPGGETRRGLMNVPSAVGE